MPRSAPCPDTLPARARRATRREAAQAPQHNDGNNEAPNKKSGAKNHVIFCHV